MSRESRIPLWPREHGTYVQLLVPLATALIAVTPTMAGGAIALGACLGFLASEPLRVVLGDRGRRLRESGGPRARRRFALLGAGSLLAGGAGLVLAPSAARAVAGGVAMCVVVVIALSRSRAVHTLLGELIAAVALAGASAPVALAGGMPLDRALVIWGAWSAGFATTVVAVHQVIAHHRQATTRSLVWRAVAVAALCAIIAALAQHDPIAWLAIVLAAPAAVVVLRPLPVTRLRAIGIGFLVASIAAASVAVAIQR